MIIKVYSCALLGQIGRHSCLRRITDTCSIRTSKHPLDNVNIRDFNYGMVVKELCTCMVRDTFLCIAFDESDTIELLTELCIN